MKREENQTVEYKESWHDEYLKWICGYANAQGGTLYVGIEDGTKRVVGVRNAIKLLEDIPNSIRNTLGIVADVVSIKRDGKDVVRIRVKPSAFPVSCRGGYFYRTGSVKMQLVGNALTDFILRKTGTSWDAYPNVSGRHVQDCRFTVLASHCLDQTGRRLDDTDFRSFGLACDDGTLTNAGALFADDSPVFQNRLFCTRWNGLNKAAGVMDALDDKEFSGSVLSLFEYGKAFVKNNSRKMWHKAASERIEFPEYPERAVEEAIANALIHRDYTVYGSEVHIDIFDDRLEVVSPGGMFDGGSPIQERPDVRAIGSARRNPIVADVFGRLRYAERRGSGLGKIVDAYAFAKTNPRGLAPSFVSDSFFTVVLPNLTHGLSKGELEEFAVGNRDTPNSQTPNSRNTPNSQDTPNSRNTPNSRKRTETGIARVLLVLDKERGNSELVSILGLKNRTDLYTRFLLPALQQGLIEYTIPDKPNSRLQKYRITAKGREAVNANAKTSIDHK